MTTTTSLASLRETFARQYRQTAADLATEPHYLIGWIRSTAAESVGILDAVELTARVLGAIDGYETARTVEQLDAQDDTALHALDAAGDER